MRSAFFISATSKDARLTYPPRWGVTLRDWLRRHPYILPIAILIAGAVFRYYNLNWDSGHNLQPDERSIYEILSGASGNPPLSWPTSISQFLSVQDPTGGSPLNPHSFNYGSLPYYLLAALAGAISMLGQHVTLFSQWAGVDSYNGLPMLGRWLSGTLDLGSLLILFFIGKRVFGYWTAVLATALGAFTVADIQLSHFYAVDTVLLPLALLTLLAAVHIAQSDRRAPYIWGGIAFGAALATKTTALLLLIPLGGAAVLQVVDATSNPDIHGWRDWLVAKYSTSAALLNRNLLWLVATLLISAVTFIVLEPYALLDRAQLVSDLQQQSTIIVSNNPPFSVPYTIQYAGTISYLYQLKNMMFWDLGLPLGLTAIVGTLFALARIRTRLDSGRAVLLLWVIPYFVFVGSFFAKFNRYMLPITPVMVLLGAAFLVWLARTLRSHWRFVAPTAIAVVVGGSLLYSIAFLHIYEQPNTRVAASAWIDAHLSPNAGIAVEGAWDDPLPLDMPGHPAAAYMANETTRQLNLYDADTPAKVQRISQILASSRYVISSSQRMTNSIPNLPDQYPTTTRYYRLLFAGKLHYKLIKQFQSHPQIGPWVVHDYAADESFHVYDHPNVRIWKRTGPVSAATFASLLSPGLTPAVSTVPDTRLMLTAQQWAQDQQAPTYDSMFPPHGSAMHHPIVIWLLLLELLGLLALPLSYLLFRGLPDRGVVIGKTIGLLVLGWLVWMAVSVHLADYQRGLIWLALLAYAVGSAALGWRLRRDIALFLRKNWRRVLVGEAVFLVGFAIFIALRMWYPDLGNQFSPVSPGNVGGGRMGEKQMELAYLNAIVRSRVFPPLDPFFSHGFINYYYYGFLLVGTLAKLTEIAPATAFNLAIATFFAMLVANIYSVGSALTRRIFPGILAAAFVGIIGNLNGAWQLLRGLIQVGSIHSSVPLVGGIADALSGLGQVVVGAQRLPPFDYWEPTRIFPAGSITEFPYFTYLFADLHPHLMAYPMTGAALALGISLALRLPRHWPTIVLTVVLGALLLGAIIATNPWDFPTYLLVAGIGVLLAGFLRQRRLRIKDLGRSVLWMAGLGLGALVLYLPFELSYKTVFTSGIGLVRDVTAKQLQSSGLCPAGNSCPSLVHDALVTPLHIYLEHFGLFLFIILTFLVVLALRAGAAEELRKGRDLALSRLPERLTARHETTPAPLGEGSLFAELVGGSIVVVLLLVVFQYFLLAFLAGMLAATGLLLYRLGPKLPARRLIVLSLLVVPIALSFGTQVFFVKDFLAGGSQFRMNTFFKFYNQAWVLYATVAACALYYVMADQVRARFRGKRSEVSVARIHATAVPVSMPAANLAEFSRMVTAEQPASPPGGSVNAASPRPRNLSALAVLAERRPWWSLALMVLVAASLIYTWAGTVSRETLRSTWLPESSVPFTLNGMAFMKVAYPGDYAAINWLNAHVHGTPVIAEANNPDYDWRSRVSMFTGLPDILNGIHEPEQRYGDEIAQRSGAVNTLYSTSSIHVARQIIRTYGVRYIYVGFSERQCNAQQCYAKSGLAKFDRMVGHGLRVAFRHGDTTIYEVTG